MQAKLDKKFFQFIVDVLQFIRITLIILSFSIILYWILEIAEVVMPPQIVVFFTSIKDFIHLFYARTVTIDSQTLDFAYLLAVTINLSTVWGLKVLIEYIRDIEEGYFKVKNTIAQKAEKTFNTILHNEYVQEESKNNKMIMLVKFNAEYTKKSNIFGETGPSDEVKAEVEKGVFNKFSNLLEQNIPCKMTIIGDDVFIYFNDFTRVDEMLVKLENIFAEIRKEYIESKWLIHSIASIDVYERSQEILLKSKMLKKLVEIFTESRIICTGTFKQRYALLPQHKYKLEIQGVYKLQDNEEVFFLRRQNTTT